jgi:hypothetical protein
MPSGGFHGTPAGGAAAAMPSGSAMARSAPAVGGAPASGGAWHATSPGAWSGPSGAWHHTPSGRPPGSYVYTGRPRPGVSVGIGVVVPLDGPDYTHDGEVQHDDDLFAGDDLYVSMTLVSTYDGRVLWHTRQQLDLDAQDPHDVDRMVESFVATLPPRGGFPPAAAPAHK